MTDQSVNIKKLRPNDNNWAVNGQSICWIGCGSAHHTDTTDALSQWSVRSAQQLDHSRSANNPYLRESYHIRLLCGLANELSKKRWLISDFTQIPAIHCSPFPYVLTQLPSVKSSAVEQFGPENYNFSIKPIIISYVEIDIIARKCYVRYSMGSFQMVISLVVCVRPNCTTIWVRYQFIRSERVLAKTGRQKASDCMATNAIFRSRTSNAKPCYGSVVNPTTTAREYNASLYCPNRVLWYPNRKTLHWMPQFRRIYMCFPNPNDLRHET